MYRPVLVCGLKSLCCSYQITSNNQKNYLIHYGERKKQEHLYKNVFISSFAKPKSLTGKNTHTRQYLCSYLGERGEKSHRSCKFAFPPVQNKSHGEVNRVKREYPQVDRHHHKRSRRLEFVVDAVLLGVCHAVEYQVHHHLDKAAQSLLREVRLEA